MVIVPLWYFLVIGGSLIIVVVGPRLFRFDRMELRTYHFLLGLAYISTRIAPLAVLYLTGWTGWYDATHYFYPQASNVLAGQIPYLDFESHYGPYFSYLMALFVLIYNDPRVIPLALIAFDLLTLVVSNRYVRNVFDDHGRKLFLWVYAFIPTLWFFTVRGNQDEILLAFFLTLSVLLVTMNREDAAGICMGIGFLFTKVLIAVFYLPLIALTSRKIRTLFATGLVVIIGYIPFVLVGADVLQPLVAEATSYTNGANIWVLVEIMGITTGVVPYLIAGVVLLFITGVYLASDSQSRYVQLIPERFREMARRLSLEERIALYGLLYMTLARKTWMFYLEIFVVFLIITFILIIRDAESRRKQMTLLLLYAAYIFVMGVVSYYSTFLLQNVGYPLTIDLLVSFTINVLGIILAVSVIMSILLEASIAIPENGPDTALITDTAKESLTPS